MGQPRCTTIPASVLVVLGLLTGCQPAPPPASTPAPPPVTSPSATPTPTPTPVPVDFTKPRVARAMISRLLAAAGSDELVMAEITAETVSVSVMAEEDVQPVTWAYRDGSIQQVDSDLEYVSQALFDIDDFRIDDVGQLFRVAATLAGSKQNQTLQIVDYSGGRVVMAVATNPESRTVFFNPDGTLLPEYDFRTATGVRRGLQEVIGERTLVSAVGIQSSVYAWVDYPGPDSTTIRRQRTSKVPVTVVARPETLSLPLFNPEVVDPAAIWKVVTRMAPEQDEEVPWSVTIDDREGTGVPRMYFSFEAATLVTDLAGRELVSG